MGYQTEADGYLDTARANIKSAIIEISRIAVEQACGWEEYNEDFQHQLKSSLSKLMEIRDKLS